MGDMIDQSHLQFLFIMFFTQGQEIEVVGVFNGLPGKIGLRLWQRGLKVVYGFTFPLIQVALDMVC
jgi:hypothetical protein